MKERMLTHIEALLTSGDAQMRARGYALLEEGINDALFCSCLNYRSLGGSFTPLADSSQAWGVSEISSFAQPNADNRGKLHGKS